MTLPKALERLRQVYNVKLEAMPDSGLKITGLDKLEADKAHIIMDWLHKNKQSILRELNRQALEDKIVIIRGVFSDAKVIEIIPGNGERHK